MSFEINCLWAAVSRWKDWCSVNISKQVVPNSWSLWNSWRYYKTVCTSFIKKLWVTSHHTTCQELSPVSPQLVNFPWHPCMKLDMSIVSSFEKAPQKEKKILVMLVDHHSKWPEVAAVWNVTAGSVYSKGNLYCLYRHCKIKHIRSCIYIKSSPREWTSSVLNRVLRSIIHLALVQYC